MEAWYKERYPRLKIGDPVPGFCSESAPEIKKGMEIELSLKLGQYRAERGDVGVVQKVFKSEDGELYEVEFNKKGASIIEIVCRPEIRKAGT